MSDTTACIRRPPTPADEDERVVALHTVQATLEALADDPSTSRVLIGHETSDAETVSIFKEQLAAANQGITGEGLVTHLSQGVELQQLKVADIVGGHVSAPPAERSNNQHEAHIAMVKRRRLLRKEQQLTAAKVVAVSGDDVDGVVSPTATGIVTCVVVNDDGEEEEVGGSHSLSVAARNQLANYCSELFTFLAFHDPKNELPRYAVEEVVSSVQVWLRQTPDATLAEVGQVEEELEHQLVVSGVALAMENRALEARTAYEAEVKHFTHWLNSTKNRTSGSGQPLSPAARYLMSDIAVAHVDWIEDYRNISAAAQVFIDRRQSLVNLQLQPAPPAYRGRGSRAQQEEEESQRGHSGFFTNHQRHLTPMGEERQQPLACRLAKVIHVANVAAQLKAKPPVALSLARRRQALLLCSETTEWLDEHRDVATDEELAEKLHSLVYLYQIGVSASETVKIRNQLVHYLDYVDSCCDRRPHIIASLSPQSREALLAVVARARAWMEENPNANIETLRTILREVKLRAIEEGLSAVETITEIQNQVSPSPARRREIEAATESPQENSSIILSPAELQHQQELQVDVACALVQELLCLKVVLRRAGNKGSTVAKSIMREEFEDVLSFAKEAAGSDALSGEAEGENADDDAPSPPLVVVSVPQLVRRYRDLLQLCEAGDPEAILVPSSCWSRLDGFKLAS